MLPKETKVVDDKRLLLNYFSNQVKRKVKHIMDDNYKDLCGHLLEVATDHKNATAKALSNWDNLIDNLKKAEFEDSDDHAEVRDTPVKPEVAKVPEKSKAKPEDNSIPKAAEKQEAKTDAKKGSKKEDKKDPKQEMSILKQDLTSVKQEPNTEKKDSNVDDLIFGHDLEKIGGAINSDNDLFDNIFDSIDSNKIPKAESFT